MSVIPLPNNFRNFMYKVVQEFNGTSFDFTLPSGKVERFNVSYCPNIRYWIDLTNKFEEARQYNQSIQLDIPFCIGYHKEIQSGVKEVFGWNIKIHFPVPQNVQDFFKFRTVLQLDKDAQSLTSKLQTLQSAISELNDCLGSSKAYLLQLLTEVEQLRRDLAEIQSKFHEADERVRALTNLEEASRKVSSLFGSVLTVLQPEFFSEMQASECSRKIFFEQMSALENYLFEKDRMVLDQREGIASFEASLRAQSQTQRENESAFSKIKQQIFCELSKLELENLPPTFTKYVEEFTIHSKVQQAASTLAAYVHKVSARNFVDSRKKAFEECSICFMKKPDYFVLSNCSHGAFCADCIARFMNRCPRCREQITSHKSISLNLFDKEIFI